METQTTVLYEVIASISNKSFVTESRVAALDYYDRGHMVFEKHITLTQPSVNTQTCTTVTL
jgi:hypothetical protein